MKKIKCTLVALLIVSGLAYGEVTTGGEVVYRLANYESNTKGNSFYLGDFQDSSEFKFNINSTLGRDMNLNFFIASDDQSSDNDYEDQVGEITLWKKLNENVEAQVRTDLVSDYDTGAIRVKEGQDENTFIRVRPIDNLSITLRPFGTGTLPEIGDLLQSYCLQRDKRGFDGEYKLNSKVNFYYLLNTNKYATDKTNTDWDTGVDGNSAGYKLKTTVKITPRLQFTGEVAGTTAKDNDSVDTGNLVQGKLAIDGQIKYDNRKLMLLLEGMAIQPNEAKTGSDKLATAIGGKIQYSDFSFIPIGNKAWINVRHYSAAKNGEALFDVSNDDGTITLPNSYTNISVVGEVYWKGLTFAQELELKHMKDAYKNQDGEITDNLLRFTSFVKFYF